MKVFLQWLGYAMVIIRVGNDVFVCVCHCVTTSENHNFSLKGSFLTKKIDRVANNALTLTTKDCKIRL